MNKTLTIDLNASCNLDCEPCYQALDGSELSVEEVVSYLKDNQNIQLGGGEPLIYKRINALVEIIAKDHHVNIATNATYIPNGFLTLEKNIRQNVELQASLHASNPVLFKEITKHDRFDDVMYNIGRLRQSYELGLTCAIYNKNFDDVPNLLSLASELDLPVRVNLVFPVNKKVTILDAKQIDQLKGYLLSRKMSGQKVDSPLLHGNNCYALQRTYNIEKTSICPIDCNLKEYISPRGKKSSCEFLGE